jgi:hypothetical protein
VAVFGEVQPKKLADHGERVVKVHVTAGLAHKLMLPGRTG